MLIELLRPMGPELGRRWLAALLLAPREERESIVKSMERRMTERYSGARVERAGDSDGLEVRFRSAPAQREGYIEQMERTFAVGAEPTRRKAAKAKRKNAG